MKRNYTSISRLLTAALMLFMVSALLIAQTPTTFNYQAVLRNTDGSTKSDVSVNIELEIHQATETGTIVYSEVHSTTTSDFGMVNLEIGSVTPATFATIDWSAGPYFVEVSVDGLTMGTSELLTVPYALHAQTAEYVDILGTEAAFNGWDKDVTDDFNGAFGSLSGIPAGLADGDDNTQLNEGQVEAYIDGDETSFNGWDKNVADDFDGAFNSLSGIPAGLSDGDDNTQLNEGQVEAYIDGNEAAFAGWDKNAADDISVAGPQEGDLIYYTSGNWVRLPRGTNGEVLRLASGLPTWEQNGTVGIQARFQFITYHVSSTIPIAFGFIDTDATIRSGTGNFTCTWNAGLDRYEITITGHSYFYNSYTTVVTLTSGYGGATVGTGSVGGDLLVYVTR